MATLVASASASSLYSSVQPEENNVFKDSLSFSNQTLLEKRKISAAVIPKSTCGTESLSMHNAGSDSEENNLLNDHGLFFRRTCTILEITNSRAYFLSPQVQCLLPQAPTSQLRAVQQ